MCDIYNRFPKRENRNIAKFLCAKISIFKVYFFLDNQRLRNIPEMKPSSLSSRTGSASSLSSSYHSKNAYSHLDRGASNNSSNTYPAENNNTYNASNNPTTLNRFLSNNSSSSSSSSRDANGANCGVIQGQLPPKIERATSENVEKESDYVEKESDYVDCSGLREELDTLGLGGEAPYTETRSDDYDYVVTPGYRDDEDPKEKDKFGYDYYDLLKISYSLSIILLLPLLTIFR